MKNETKYLSYQKAWDRIKSATESGYYLETVALCESIMSDRLISYIQGVSGISMNLTTPFAKLIKAWKNNPGSVSCRGFSDLPTAVDEWRKKRNTVVHGMVKSNPGTSTQPVESFFDMAEETATEGILLARAVCEWHRKQLRSAKGQITRL